MAKNSFKKPQHKQGEKEKDMKRTKMRLTVVSLVAAAVLALAVVAFAGNPHIVGRPSCGPVPGGFSCSGKVAGLGKGEAVLVHLDVQVDVTCINPGGQVVPGQSGIVSGQAVVGPTTRNGNQDFDVFASLDGLGCPNDNWTAQINWTNANLYLSNF